MNKKLFVLVFVLPLALFGAILPGLVIPRAHAALTGLVCIAGITDVANGKCPAAPGPIFDGPFTTPNTLIRVPVMINDTDTFNGFDVTVNSTRDSGGHSVLKPYGLDLTGSLMPANSIPLAECVGTTSVVGAACGVNATIDNPASIRVAIIFPTFLPIGTTGLLFTAIFSINGTSLPGGVNINFQNHCDPSTSSDGQFCISIGNGTKSGAPETIQTGSFDNSVASTSLPYVTLTTPTANLGQSLVGSPAHALPTVTYTATSQNNFQTSSTPQLALAVKFNGSGTRPTTSLNMTTLDLTGLAAHPFTQTGNVATNVPVGVYIATVTAAYTTADTITFTTDYLEAAYALPVNVTDYVFSTSASTVSLTPPAGGPLTATVAPKASFNNPVKLGITIPAATASAGIGATFSSYTISGGSGTSTLTITTSASTPGGTFSLTVSSNSTINGFTITHTKILTINTIGFTISASAPPAQPLGTAATSTITVSFSHSFSGTVALTNNTITNLSCLAITPASKTANGTATIQCNSTVKGIYTLTVTGTSGSNSISVSVTFNFTIQIHDVLITATVVTPTTSANVGAKVTVKVTVENKGAQSENVTVYLLTDSQLTINSTSVIVPANSSQDVTLTWNTASYTAKAYTLSAQVQLPSSETNQESGTAINPTIGSYTLNSTSSPPAIDNTTLAIIVGVIAAVAVIGGLLALRMRKKPSEGGQVSTPK